MDNVIRFPNSELKRLRELKNKHLEIDSESNDEKKKAYEVFACIPVKFIEPTGHDEYFMIVSRKNKSYVFETTEYIKVDSEKPLDKENWIYPEKGKGMSGFEFENSNHIAKKYRFLHSAYANQYMYLYLTEPDSFHEKYLKFLWELPMTMQINGRNDYKYSLNIDRVNEFGLILSRGYTDELEILNIGRTQSLFPYLHGLSAVVYDNANERLMFLEAVTLREGIDERNGENLLELENVLFVENKKLSDIYLNDFLSRQKTNEVTNG